MSPTGKSITSSVSNARRVDIRFVFSNPNNRLYRNSPTTYAAYCEKHNFTYATRTSPQEWLDEGKEPTDEPE